MARGTTGAAGRLLLFWALCTGPAAAAYLCEAPADGVSVEVDFVIDGDTIALTDGERVRVVGLNAPESGRRGAPGEAYAREATRLLETLVHQAGNRVRLHQGEEARDGHGRLLARISTPTHGDLAGHLILQGLAYAVAVAPNTGGARCHFALERRARAAERGLWVDASARITPATRVEATGFAIVAGKVISTRQRANDVLLQLDGEFFVRVMPGAIDRATRPRRGQRVEVRGWVHPWAGEARALTVSHPAMIDVSQARPRN